MSSVTLSVTRVEASLMLRRYANLAWLALPIAAAVAMAAIPAATRANPAWGGSSALELYHAPLIILCVILLSLMVLPEDVATYREIGYLRRLHATPMRPWSLLTARAVVTLAMQTITAAAVVIAPVTSGASELAHVWGLVLSFAALSAALLGLGMLVAGAVPNRKVATLVNTVLFVVLALFAGLWIPRPAMPDWLASAADWSPTGAAAEALVASLTGPGPDSADLLIMLGWGVAFSVLALVTFRWDQRSR